MMKVVLVNRSDSTGGAAVVTRRLMHALRAEGVDARMLVLEKLTDDPHVISYASPAVDKFNFLAERLSIFTHNGFSRANLFKIDLANYGRDISRLDVVRDADVVMLNWVNQGAMSLRGVAKLCGAGKPVIWTMHDMWLCTGVCHHAFDCNGYVGVCSGCRYLGSDKPDLSTTVQMRKSKIYAAYPGIHFVAVSNWLAGCCRRSRLLRDMPVTVIPNAIDVSKFTCERQHNGKLGIADDKIVMAMGAARLDDPIKGFDLLIDATECLCKAHAELAGRLHLVLFGDIRDHSLLDRLRLPYTYVGRVSGVEALTDIYTQADMVLSSSRFETLPGTLVEGMACGCRPVTFGNGGQADIVDHLVTGYVAPTVEAEAMADGIAWAATAAIDRQMLHDTVERKFAAHVVARKYIELCKEIIQTK